VFWEEQLMIVRALAAMGIALASAAVLSASAGAEEYPVLNLRYASFDSPSTPQSSVVQWWANELGKRSGGKIKVKFYWSETLGKANEILGLVGSGGVELGQTAASYYPAQLPLSAMANNLPMTFSDNKTAVDVAIAGLKEPSVEAELGKQGVKLLWYNSLSNYHVVCTKPVKALADFNGLKIRSYGEFIPKMWASIGAVGVNVIGSEIYDGLQRGSLDCAYWPPDYLMTYKLYEVAKYVSTANFGAIAGQSTFVSLQTWHKWPENVRKLFEEVSAEAVVKDKEAVAAAYDKSMTELGKRAQIVEFTEQEQLKQKVPNLLNLWVSSMAAKGLEPEAKKLSERAKAVMGR
jgi:TRAP-type C4-dicarboxylate transport system substrate-binding protein